MFWPPFRRPCCRVKWGEFGKYEFALLKQILMFYCCSRESLTSVCPHSWRMLSTHWIFDLSSRSFLILKLRKHWTLIICSCVITKERLYPLDSSQNPNPSKRWKQAQYRAEQFPQRWPLEYMHTLQPWQMAKERRESRCRRYSAVVPGTGSS